MARQLTWPTRSAIAVLALSTFAIGCGDKVDVAEIVVPVPILTGFTQTNLVADIAGTGAVTIDPLLINAWGLSFSPNGALYVANAETGTVTTYGPGGLKLPVTVTIPSPLLGGTGSPTGLVVNTTTDFKAGSNNPAEFLVASEDGTISAWNAANGTNAVIVVDRTGNGSVYKGAAIAASNGANFLYAADFHNGQVDVFNTTFQFVKSFTDATIPAGYAPFNVASIGGQLYVTFAKQLGPANEDDETGLGNGFVDVFNTDGTLVRRFATGGQLNSPWAVVAVPSGYGTIGGTILIGNFGDGHIGAYDAATGQLLDLLRDGAGNAISIQGLWGLTFGPQAVPTLYFASGPGGESHGLVGTLTPR